MKTDAACTEFEPEPKKDPVGGVLLEKFQERA